MKFNQRNEVIIQLAPQVHKLFFHKFRRQRDSLDFEPDTN